jgi:CRISPR/Cas system CSM-associated protein Csm3 (group 7 of RAMP superfamily)
MLTGKLGISGGGRNQKLTVEYRNAANNYCSVPISDENELSLALLECKRSNIQGLKGVAVLLEEENQKPKRIREVGTEWDRVAVKPELRPVSNVNGFHNPYNFIPAPPRVPQHPELGDHRPVAHGVYHPDHWTGQITVKLTTITPLLIPDASQATETHPEHKSYPIRIGADGLPYLPPTSIKGMLRSAYEAITNSRFAVFQNHGNRLAYRRPAKLETIPARDALFPVTISRSLYTLSPEEMLEPSLRPAKELSELSPADRVFGWVRQQQGGGAAGAYKGNLRIHDVQCLSVSEQVIERFGEQGFPLAILGQPKPQQTRFYTAKDQRGTPLEPKVSKASGYENGAGLRGRKVYPHHQVPDSYWQTPTEDWTQVAGEKGHYQEYRHPSGKEERSNQNRSIQAWVKPGVEFSFKIDITNLSSVELGGLLWLLSLPEGHYHRIGGGKPLGFGSVQLKIDHADLRKGEAWKSYYADFWGQSPGTSQEQLDELKKKFEDVAPAAFGQRGQSFSSLYSIRAFLACAKGFDDGKPIHYPRARAANHAGPVPPNPEGEAFKWFVTNERDGRDAGPKVALPPLWDETGLPILTSK